ncbi:uncharacterized protein VTP21DRAFT_5260 [Calcarisporiella thermophila]|uniref:uncharacterized protein n=1 Tax=Calcarisporiella thermophila TaxID=911321 RepID=UPI0037422423
MPATRQRQLTNNSSYTDTYDADDIFNDNGAGDDDDARTDPTSVGSDSVKSYRAEQDLSGEDMNTRAQKKENLRSRLQALLETKSDHHNDPIRKRVRELEAERERLKTSLAELRENNHRSPSPPSLAPNISANEPKQKPRQIPFSQHFFEPPASSKPAPDHRSRELGEVPRRSDRVPTDSEASRGRSTPAVEEVADESVSELRKRLRQFATDVNLDPEKGDILSQATAQIKESTSRLEAKEEMVARLEQQRQELEARCKALENDLAGIGPHTESKYDDMTQEKGEVSGVVRQLRDELEAKEGEIARLKLEVEASEAKYSQQLDEHAKMLDSIKREHEQQIARIRDEVSAQNRTELDEVRRAVADREKQIAALVAERDRMKEEAEKKAAAAANEAREAREKEIGELLRDASMETERLRRELEEKTTKLEQMQVEITQKERALGASQGNSRGPDEKHALIERLQKDLEEARQSLKISKHNQEVLAMSLAEKEKALDALRNECAAHRQLASETHRDFTAYQQQSAASLREKEELVTSLRAELEEAQKQLRRATEELRDQMQNALTEKEHDLEQFQNACEAIQARLHSDLGEAHAELKRVSKERDMMKEQLVEKEAEIEKVRRDSQRSQRSQRSLQDDQGNRVSVPERVQKELDDLRRASEQIQRERDGEAEMLRRERQSAEQESIRAKRQLEEVNAKLSFLKKERDEAREKLRVAEAEVERVKSALDGERKKIGHRHRELETSRKAHAAAVNGLTSIQEQHAQLENKLSEALKSKGWEGESPGDEGMRMGMVLSEEQEKLAERVRHQLANVRRETERTLGEVNEEKRRLQERITSLEASNMELVNALRKFQKPLPPIKDRGSSGETNRSGPVHDKRGAKGGASANASAEEVARLRAELTRLKEAIYHARQKLEKAQLAHQAELNELHERLEKQASDHEFELGRTIARHTEVLHAFSADVNNVVERMRKRHEVVATELSHQRKVEQEARGEVWRLKKELEARSEYVKDLEGRNRCLEVEYSELLDRNMKLVIELSGKP